MPTLSKTEVITIEKAIAAAIKAALVSMNWSTDLTRQQVADAARDAAHAELVKITPGG